MPMSFCAEPEIITSKKSEKCVDDFCNNCFYYYLVLEKWHCELMDRDNIELQM